MRSSRPHVPVLGVTGAAGAGKSYVAALLRELGCDVLDADRMGHDALDRPAVAHAVARAFGRAAVGPDGRVDRRRLAAIAFADRAALRRLEELVHPVVLREIRRALRARPAKPPRARVVDCALLFESGLDALCDTTVAVVAPRAVRLRRVAESRGWTAADLRRREAAQMSAAQKAARADHVVRNTGDRKTLERRARALLDQVAPAPARPPGRGRR